MRLHAWALACAALSLVATGCDDGASDPASFTVGDDQCNGTTDTTEIMRVLADAGVSDAGVENQTEMAMILDHCAREECISGLLDEEGVACMRQCVGASSAGSLSVGCTDCFIFSVTCGVENCVTECLDSSSPTCLECTDLHCNPATNACLAMEIF